jgi:hypothetical protein
MCDVITDFRLVPAAVVRESSILTGGIVKNSEHFRRKKVDALSDPSKALARWRVQPSKEKNAPLRYDGELAKGGITDRALVLIALMCSPYFRQWT